MPQPDPSRRAMPLKSMLGRSGARIRQELAPPGSELAKPRLDRHGAQRRIKLLFREGADCHAHTLIRCTTCVHYAAQTEHRCARNNDVAETHGHSRDSVLSFLPGASVLDGSPAARNTPWAPCAVWHVRQHVRFVLGLGRRPWIVRGSQVTCLLGLPLVGSPSWPRLRPPVLLPDPRRLLPRSCLPGTARRTP